MNEQIDKLYNQAIVIEDGGDLLMNNRITEFSAAAADFASNYAVGSPMWMNFYNEKFAELIVRECAAIALREDHEPSECILTHFGVER